MQCTLFYYGHNKHNKQAKYQKAVYPLNTVTRAMRAQTQTLAQNKKSLMYKAHLPPPLLRQHQSNSLSQLTKSSPLGFRNEWTN